MELAELIKQMLEGEGIKNFGAFGVEGPYNKIKKALLEQDWGGLDEEMVIVMNICASVAYEQAAGWLQSIADVPWDKESLENFGPDSGCSIESCGGIFTQFAPSLRNVLQFLSELEKKFSIHPEYQKRASERVQKVMCNEKIRPIVKAYVKAELPSLS